MSRLTHLAPVEVHLPSLPEMRGFARGMLTAIPGGAALIFDRDMRVQLAEGSGFAHAGLRPEALLGRVLPDVIPADMWAALKGPYTATLLGESTRFELTADGATFTVLSSPLVLAGRMPGGLAIATEITDERRLEGEAETAESLLQSTFEGAPIGMTVVGPDGRWLMVNDAYCSMLGYTREELTGSDFSLATHPDDAIEDNGFMVAAMAGKPISLDREKRYVRKDGSTLWAHVRAESSVDEQGRVRHIVSHIQDISERRAAAESLRASERTLRSVIDNTPAVISVKGRDLRYQLVNREFEEVFGVPSDWIIGRADEELLEGRALDAARAKDQRVLDGGESPLEEETSVHGGRERVSLTMRFPLVDEDGGVLAVCGISTDVTERRNEERSRRERAECSERIGLALAEDRFVLLGQPIVNLASGRAEQSELLIRMRESLDETKMVPPGDFLPAAERFGFMGDIDNWVLDRALELAAASHRVEVNLSAMTICDPAQVDLIERKVIDSGAPPQNLVFEITETAVAENLDAARDFAVRLRELGCSFALDDFGVGHGTFKYLRHLPVDYLKIDIQFVRKMMSDEGDRQVVQAIIGVAAQFGIKTIAEGVEDQATLDELGRMGADYAQGYFIGYPGPLSELVPYTHDSGDTHAGQ